MTLEESSYQELVNKLQSEPMPITTEEWERAKRLDEKEELTDEPEWTAEQKLVAKKLRAINDASTDEINW